MNTTRFCLPRGSLLPCLLLGMAVFTWGSVAAEAADIGTGLENLVSSNARIDQDSQVTPAGYPCPLHRRPRSSAPCPTQVPAESGAAAGAATPSPGDAAPGQPAVDAAEPEVPVDLAQTAPQRAPTASPGAAPNMLGDSMGLGGDFVYSYTTSGSADIPLAAASRRVKIAENNSPVAQDRAYILYNHFQNALDASEDATPSSRSFSVDRYTIGLEKSCFDGAWSVEVRMPFASQMDFQTPDYGINGGEFGNLAIGIKRVLYQNACGALSVGLGIDTPTGSDVTGRVLSGFNEFTQYRIHNESVHLLPYVGILRTPNQRSFFQGFAQIDIPTNGNRITYSAPLSSGSFGVLNEQTLLYLDVGVGYWLYRNPCACGLTGLAALVEFHYTTTLQDADSVTDGDFYFGNSANRVDIPNLTVGLHSEIANHTLVRVGGVLPLDEDDDRYFDAEVQVQLERRF